MSEKICVSQWLKVFLSSLAALFGVQSEKNRDRDFNSGKFAPYLLSGLLVAILFVVFVILLVRLALHLAGV